MINQDISKDRIIQAITEIDKNGIPTNRNSTKFNLVYKDKLYPPKYVLAIANKFVTGKELEPDEHSGGNETNQFLEKLGFEIRLGNNIKTNDRRESKKNEVHVTALIKNFGVFDNESRYLLLNEIIKIIDYNVNSITLPAGFLNFDNFGKNDLQLVERRISKILIDNEKDIVVCFGIDVDKSIHQFGIAVSPKGILSVGRKFFPTDEEKNKIVIANSFEEKEFGYERTFNWKSKKYFLAVCYDCFGIKHKQLPNKGIDYIINLVHEFFPHGESGSGEVYFAKHGIAGASKQWNCPTFASAVFVNRDVPMNWQSGIIWNKGNLSTRLWKYEDNPLFSYKMEQTEYKNEIAILRYFEICNELN